MHRSYIIIIKYQTVEIPRTSLNRYYIYIHVCVFIYYDGCTTDENVDIK